MVKSCCVVQCREMSWTLPKSFHRIPRNEEAQAKWLHNISQGGVLKMTKSVTHATVCSKHFVASDYMAGCRRNLKPNVVPSVFAWTCKKKPKPKSKSKPKTKQKPVQVEEEEEEKEEEEDEDSDAYSSDESQETMTVDVDPADYLSDQSDQDGEDENKEELAAQYTKLVQTLRHDIGTTDGQIRHLLTDENAIQETLMLGCRKSEDGQQSDYKELDANQQQMDGLLKRKQDMCIQLSRLLQLQREYVNSLMKCEKWLAARRTSLSNSLNES